MSITGNFVDADEALRLGLVNHVVPHDELLPFTVALVRRHRADRARSAEVLDLYRRGDGLPLADALALEAAHAAGRSGRPRGVRRGGCRGRGAGQAVSDDSTRARVVDAAIACILDEGFYRASSNKIASRAGVTWGVIQYHFGTREALMVAVHERGLDELDRVPGRRGHHRRHACEARLESFVDALWAYYRRPEFLAYMQVVLNLSHDPTTADSTRAALKSVGTSRSTSGCRRWRGRWSAPTVRPREVERHRPVLLQRRARPRPRPGAARGHAGRALDAPRSSTRSAPSSCASSPVHCRLMVVLRTSREQ